MVITFLLTYIALTLSNDQISFNTGAGTFNRDRSISQAATPPNEPLIDTTNWTAYQDRAYPIAFLHPKDWTVKGAVNNLKFYDLTLNPAKTNQNIHILISRDSFYGLEGMKQTPHLVGNQTGFIVSDNLVGIKMGEYYYTFDGTMNPDQTDEFAGLLSTVTFQ